MSNPEIPPIDPSDNIIRASVGPDSLYLIDQQPDVYTDDELDAEAGEWDLPSADVAPRVVSALKQLLAANGFSENQVVVSGYDWSDSQSGFEAGKLEYSDDYQELSDAEEDIRGINAELAQLYNDGILGDNRRQQAREEITGLRARINEIKAAVMAKDARVAYYFAPLVALEERGNALNNHSVYYAGGGKGATIGVYDRQALAGLGSDPYENHLLLGESKKSDDPGDIYIVDTSRQELETAKLAELYVKYNDPAY